MNVFEVDPAATVADAGTVNVGFVFDSVTTAPPVGAAALRLTVQTAVPELLRVDGLHVRPVTVGSAPPLTLPPDPDRLILSPEAEAAIVLVIPIAVLLTPDAIDRVITATVPLAIVLASDPDAMQV